MVLFDEIKQTLKNNKKLFILIIIISIATGIILSLIEGRKKEWSLPPDINREYQGEILQKLLKGENAPDVQNNERDVVPQRREQIERGIDAPRVDERQTAPKEKKETYSDF